MNILHVSLGRPPFYTGGLVRYSEDLMIQQLNMGHNIGLIYPGHSSFNTKTRISTKKEDNGLVIYEIINPLPIAIVSGVSNPKRYCRACNSNCFDNFFDETKPDVIHVHSFMGMHKEFFESAKKHNIRLIFTTHDYYPFCLRCSLLDANGQLCYEHSPEKCMNCNKGMGLPPMWEMLIRSKMYKHLKYTDTFKKLRLIGRRKIKSGKNTVRQEDISNTKSLPVSKILDTDTLQTKPNDNENILRYEQLLKYYEDILKLMDVIHCNSEMTGSIYKRNFPELTYKTIAITHKDIPKRNTVQRINGTSFKIGYLNGMIVHKGIDILLNAFSKLQDTDTVKWELELWGDDYSSIADGNRIHNHGKYEIERIETVFASMDLLVVPSLWWETFGFVVIEALAYGLPVVCSDRVGACMLLKDTPTNFIYQADDANELRSIIENLSQKEIYESAIDFVNKLQINMGIEAHAKKIMELYCK